MNPLQFVREAQALVHRDEAGKLLAEAKWRRLNAHTIEVFHTHVDDSLRGQGAGNQLLDAMEKLAAQEGWSVRASCPFAQRRFSAA
ncbi:GNAT family N-acetyltransferase [Kingella sp. SNUBH-2017]|jgi:acetyltransferase, GNAT family|uniref:N-acetyltransferase n=1 Tax=Kingella pumchi TaxID=2779506 RepID=A0ABS9NP96_9NEIS|nr:MULTISPECIES: GNAT family N-acetyltransferase [Kingella]MCG6504609.1 N-acetyltransferase [Kingella pumchi]MDD2183771.1 GNAT family N-acetyltransferase [Kingella sp. SNUBH-2017]